MKYTRPIGWPRIFTTRTTAAADSILLGILRVIAKSEDRGQLREAAGAVAEMAAGK
jgi:hypothetical protein